MEGPRSVRRDEFKETMGLLDDIFRGGQRGRMESEFATVYRNEEKICRNLLIIKEEGRIVSHVALIPRRFHIDGITLKVGGIGGVATHPDYRRRGFAGILLKEAIRRMEKEGYDISILGGDRHRYRWFGWETAGRQYIHVLNKRSLPFLSKTRHLRIRRYKNQDLDRIRAVHARFPLRVERKRRDYQLLFQHPDTRILVCEDKKKFGYILLRAQEGLKDKRVLEFGGNPDCVETLLRYLIEEENTETVTIPAPAYYKSAVIQSLNSVASSWTIEPVGMVRVINLYSLLEKYAILVNKRLKERPVPKGRFVLENRETKEAVTLDMDRRLRVCEGAKSRRKLSLSSIEMVRLLFGEDWPHAALKTECAGLLSSIFPINFYWWPIDNI